MSEVDRVTSVIVTRLRAIKEIESGADMADEIDELIEEIEIARDPAFREAIEALARATDVKSKDNGLETTDNAPNVGQGETT
ncbi:MAG: hypothetical protein ACYTEQ_00940 [Planctomycetota bacterium]|jgi:hypothetical protein